MNTYVIIRKQGWTSTEELRQAAERSSATEEQMPDDIRWIPSYVLNEPDRTVGTLCGYQASSPDAIRRHAQRADLPVTEIIPSEA